MSRTRALSTVAVAVGLALQLASARAGAVPPRLAGVASRGVLAAQDAQGQGGVRTAFAFGDERTIVVSAGAGGPVRLITSFGAAAGGQPGPDEDGLAVVHLSGLGLRPLHRSAAGEIRQGTPAYVLGAPLGYEAGRIRSVHLPRIMLASSHLVSVPGSLPSVFEGAPVVTRGGRVIGAVARVGVGTWVLAPRGSLLALIAGTSRASGSGVPILSVLGGALLVFIAGTGFGVVRASTRRRRAAEASELRRRRAPRVEPLLQQPLVRLRTPEPESPEPAIEEAEDDFDVIVKPREDS